MVAPFAKRRVRTEQPLPGDALSIDWDNPITKDMTVCLMHADQAFGLVTYVDGFGNTATLPTIPYASPNVIQHNTPLGTGARIAAGTGAIYDLVSKGAINSPSYSLFAVGSCTSTTNIQSALDMDNSSGRYLQFRIDAGKVDLIPFNSSKGNTGRATSPVAMTLAEMSRGFTMGGVVSPTRTVAFQNGALIQGAALTGTPVTPGVDIALRVGSRQTGTQLWNTGGLMLVAVWMRALADAEMVSLSDNPWQLFKPRFRRVLAFLPSIDTSATWLDTLTAADLTSAVYFSAAQVAEILAATENSDGSLTAAVSASDALASADATASQQASDITVTESLSALDALSTQLQAFAAISESLAAAESSSSQLQTAASSAEALAATDSGSSQLQASVSVVEALAALDVLSAQATMAVQLLEAGTASDSSYTGAAAVQAHTQDNLTASEVITSMATLQATLAEALLAVDATSGTGQYVTVCADALGAQDQPTAGAAVYSVVVGDLLVAIDANSTVSVTSATQVEALVAQDLVELEQSGDSGGESAPSVSVELDLHKALVSGVVACNLGVPLTAPNLPFTRPVDGSPWVSVSVEKDNRAPTSLGTGGFDLQEGALEVAINVAALRGTAELRAIEAFLADGFRIGRTLTYGSATAMVTGFGDVKDEPTPGHFSRTVKVYWQAYVTRPI